jgi:CarD family transcriptional regulator
MPFSEGQTIVHPHHGPVRVDRVVERVIGGSPRAYLELAAGTATHPLTISVPADRAAEIGLREVASPARVAELLALLEAPQARTTQQWARRMKDHQERLSRGDLQQTVLVIREIAASGAKPGATAEGQLLRQALAVVAAEVAAALRITPAEAEAAIEAALRRGGHVPMAATA